MSLSTPRHQQPGRLRRAGIGSLCAMLSLAALLSGCSTPEKFGSPLSRLFDKSTEDVAPQREERSQTAQSDFDQRRDFAEYQAALAYQKQGDAAACRQALDKLIDRNPDHRLARLRLAELIAETGAPAAGIEHVRYVLDKNPADAEAHHALAVLLDATGDEATALEHYQKADALEPGNELYRTSYRAALTAATDETALPDSPTRPDDASSGDSETAPAPPKSSITVKAVYDDSAVRTVSADEETDREEAPALAAQEAGAMLDAGRKALAEGDAAAATEFFRQAASANPHNPQIPSAAAASALRANQPEVAVAILQDAVESFPRAVPLHQALAVAYYRRGDYQSSQVAAQQALSLDKSSALSYFLVGSALSRLGQTEGAEAHLRQAESLDPRYAPSR